MTNEHTTTITWDEYMAMPRGERRVCVNTLPYGGYVAPPRPKRQPKRRKR